MAKTGSKNKNGKSKYNGVSKRKHHSSNDSAWLSQVTINGHKYYSVHKTEREAAIASDKIYILFGLYNRLNILKKK